MRALLVAFALAALPVTAKPPADLEKLVIGAWLCRENCFDEEYDFVKEGGERLLRTFTHARPSIAGARWTLEGNRLVVYEYDGKTVQYDFRVIRATAKRLVLEKLDREGEPPVVLDRIVEKSKRNPAPSK